MTPALPLAIGLLVAAACLTPVLVRAIGRETGWVLAGVFGGALALLAPSFGPALDGQPATWARTWVPGLFGEGADAQLALRLDGLAVLFAIIVLGIGVLVLAYTARYTPAGRRDTRTLSLLTVFAAAMLTLVLADDVVLLYVGWELTSVVSFLLIAGDGVTGATPARRAFVITVVGGLSLLAAVTLAANAAGTTSLSAILASDAVTGSPLLPAIALLLLVAVATKSALVPFGFWLRGAMVAPTPISTYLHAATMVKAGIYLLARTTPLTVEVGWWVPVVVTAGLATTVLGGVQALRATDLKALLAGSTVSQLGFIAATLALGSEEALVAGLLHTAAHAAFKASLFTVTGVVDHEAGSRDLRELGGLRRTMPVTATIAVVAGLSMAGVPPLLGFVSKEGVLASFGERSALLLVLVAAAAVLTTAYTLRFVLGAFFGDRPGRGHDAPLSFLAAPATVALVGVAAGLLLGPVDRLLGAAAAAAAGESTPFEPHLALWHGVNAPLLGSAAALAGGYLLWRAVGRRETQHAPGLLDGPRLFDRLNDALVDLGVLVARPFLSLRPTGQLTWILASIVAVLLAVAATSSLDLRALPAGSVAEWGLVAVIALTLAVVIRTSSRLGAAALIGGIGFSVTGVYVLRRAPDLAMTQLLVEALTVVLIVLVFRGLPERFQAPNRRRLLLTSLSAFTAGVTASLVAALLLGPRSASSISRYYLELAEEETGGSNVVNTILVDFRGLDTMGEITVLAVACIGVYVVTRRRRRGEDARGMLPTDERRLPADERAGATTTTAAAGPDGEARR